MVFVKGTDFLLEGGESSLPDRLLRRAARPDRGGHRPRGRCLPRAGRRRCVSDARAARARATSAACFRDSLARLPPPRLALHPAVGRRGRARRADRRGDRPRAAHRPLRRDARRSPRPSCPTVVELPRGRRRSSPRSASTRCTRSPTGEPPGAGQALVAGFEAFTPLFFAVAAGGASGSRSASLALIVPGRLPGGALVLRAAGGGDRGRARRRRRCALAASSCRASGGARFGLVRARQPRGRRCPALVIRAPVRGASPRAPTAPSGRWPARCCAASVTTPFVALFSTLALLRPARAPARRATER